MSNIFTQIIQTPNGRFALFLGAAAIIIGGVALYANFDGAYIPNGKVGVETPGTLSSGGVGMGPYFQLGQELSDVVGVRYKFRINENVRGEIGKIIFGWKRLYNPTTNKEFFSLETTIGNHETRYSDNQYNCIWPPQGIWLNEAGVSMSVADYSKNGMVGVRQLDNNTRLMFPRQNSGIDVVWNSEIQKVVGLTKIEVGSQIDIIKKDIVIEYMRGETFTSDGSLTNWGSRFVFDENGYIRWNDENGNGRYDGGEALCDSHLPPGLYRKWTAKIIIDNVQYNLEYALSEDRAQYFAPWEINTFATEFFDLPEFFQAYFWDLEIFREGGSAWQPLKKWRVGYQSDNVINIGYGDKLAVYNGKPVIEISNDGTDTYYKIGDIFEIPAIPSPTGAISAFPNPCVIPAEQTTCSTIINWNTVGGATGTRVTVTGAGNPETVFAESGASGSSSAGWIQGTPNSYLFKLYSIVPSISAPLAQVTVTGATGGTVQPSVCSTGSIRACIDSIIPNPVNKGQTITFTGHGESNNNKPIRKYRWRLDSTRGRARICAQGENSVCQFNSSSISLGTHKIYFRVRVGGLFSGWSKWISREFEVR